MSWNINLAPVSGVVEPDAVTMEFTREVVQRELAEVFERENLQVIEAFADARTDAAEILEVRAIQEIKDLMRLNDGESVWFNRFGGQFGHETVGSDADGCGDVFTELFAESLPDGLRDECGAEIVATLPRHIQKTFVHTEFCDLVCELTIDGIETVHDVRVFFRISRP